jgi:hypothetical protein
VTASAQKLDGIERAAQEHEVVRQQSPSNNPGSDPSSVPVIVPALLGGGLVTVAAGTTVLRFRYRGAIGAATA